MFATTCSKPDVMNASRHQKTTKSWAPSERSRTADQIARHTRALHSTPRQNSWTEVSCDLAASIAAIILPPGVSGASTPDACTIAPKMPAPTRLPPNENASVPPAWPQLIDRRSAPCVSVIMFDVASSPPAVTTRVSATPKTRPWTSLVHGEPTAASGPAALTMSTTATPMYAPASAACTR